MDGKTGAEPADNGPKQRINNRLGSASTSNVPSQANHIASRQTSNTRATSAKYYDIASTILGGSGDVEEVFLNAAKNGNLAKLEQLLQQREAVDLNIDCKDKRTGNTALIWAAKRGHSKIVELLLRNGADTTLCNYEAQTALETAFSPIRTLLLDWLDGQPGNSEKLLLQAAWQGNLAVINRILHDNPRVDVNCQNAEGLTPLMLVARDTLLFERLSNQLNRYYSPAQVVEQLLGAQADIHVTDNDGRSSLHYASQSRATVADKLVSALISGGMDVELRDRRLFTPIHLASQLGNTSNVVALADGGSSVNIKGFAGLTPLHMTAYNDHQKTAVTLLHYGADVKVTDDRGLTPLDVAKTRRMKNMLKEAWAERDKEEEGNLEVEEKPAALQKKTGLSVSQQEERGRKKSALTKKKPEVIFDGYDSNKNSSNSRLKGSAQSQAAAASTCLVPALIDDPRCGRCIITKSQSPKFTGGLGAAWLGRVKKSPIPKARPNSKQGGQVNGHSRSSSDSQLPKAADLAASCDCVVAPTRGKKGVRRNGVVNRTPRSHVFITQQAAIMEESVKKSSSPDNEDNMAKMRVLDSPLDLARCRSFFKEEFILEESRPKELHSGSDPTSSYSGSSLSSSSPRETLGASTPLSSSSSVPNQPLTSRSLRLDPSLETLLEQPADGSQGRHIVCVNPPTHSASNNNHEQKSGDTSQGKMNPISDDHNKTRDDNNRSKSVSDMQAVPIIRTHRPLQQQHHQRVRRRSENSLSSSVESDHGFSLLQNKPKHQPLGRAGSLKLADRWRHHSVAGLPAENLDLASISGIVQKSQSLESISPKAGSEASGPFSHANQAQNSLASEDQNVNLLRKIQRSEDKLDQNNIQNLTPSNQSASPARAVAEKQRSVPSTVEPFSGKAKIVCSSDMDKWDSYPSVDDEVIHDTYVVKVPVLKLSTSDDKPSESKCKQRQAGVKPPVTSKSCSEVADNQTVFDQQPVDSIRPQTVLDGPIGSDTFHLLERSHTLNHGLQSTRDTSQSKNLSAKGSILQSHEAFADVQGNPLSTSQNKAVVINIVDPEKHQDRLFAVTEESVRKGSASKQRADARAAAAQAKFREAAGVSSSQKTKPKDKDQKQPAADQKLKSASKASFIEKNLMRNQRNVQASASTAKSKAGSGQTGNKGINSKPVISSKVNTASVAGKTSSLSNMTANDKITPAKSCNNNLATSANTAAGNRNASVVAATSNKAQTENTCNVSKGKCEKTSDKINTKTVQKIPQDKSKLNAASVPSSETIVQMKASEIASQSDNSTSNPQSTQGKGQAPLQTPVIVNPYENFVNKFVKANETVTDDAVVKLKKTVSKGSKKSSKCRPTSGSTRNGSAGKKRAARTKPGEGESRPKSGKKTKKAAASEKKSKQATPTTESELTEDAKNPNTALISGIGWQLSTACADSSAVEIARDPKYYLSDSDPDTFCSDNEVDDDDDLSEFIDTQEQHLAESENAPKTLSALESARDNIMLDSERQRNLLEVDQRLREAFKEKMTDHSPRFLEMKWRQETQTELRLPLAEDDGFPPMNLDVTQHLRTSSKHQDKSQRENKKHIYMEDYYIPLVAKLGEGLAETEKHILEANDYQREIFHGKLTPIPEGPSLLSRTTNAISAFDKDMKGSKLSLLLDDNPENCVETQDGHTAESILDTQNKLSKAGKSAKVKSQKEQEHKKKDTEVLKNEISLKYEYTPSGKVVKKIKGVTSEGSKYSHGDNSTARNDKNNNEEEIEEAIDEILSSTTSSLASTLRNYDLDEHNNSFTGANFGCHSLTDGDRSLLLRLRNSDYTSPFYAKTKNNSLCSNDENDPPTPTEENQANTKPALSLSMSLPVQRGTTSASSPKKSPADGRSSKDGNPPLSSRARSSGQQSSGSPLTSSRLSGKPPLSVRSSLQDMNQGTPKGKLTRSSSNREIGKHETNIKDVNEEEAKHLARVINSFRHMELHASPNLSSHAAVTPALQHPLKTEAASLPVSRSACGFTRGSSGNLPLTTATAGAVEDVALPPRPSSSSGSVARKVGRFHELKEEKKTVKAGKSMTNIGIPVDVSEPSTGDAVKKRLGGSEAIAKDDASNTDSRVASKNIWLL
ncbi:sps1/ste20-related protein kinase ysk4 [Plakobranchus ocellatus]|uniref:Sps1/ste20-related protein kinase ysk4 n=1 Tax=Plakobranchus ocellatus TaxID=259542 RepID=A0AAV4A1J3_9GAST|nr:sps1/ste20-related protein kinase ysk4 [Plakobranchus ocellatus]